MCIAAKFLIICYEQYNNTFESKYIVFFSVVSLYNKHNTLPSNLKYIITPFKSMIVTAVCGMLGSSVK